MLTVSQSTRHSACEPFTLAPCADSDRQKFIEEKVRRFDGVKIWRNVGTGLAIDVDSYANRVNQWIWACPGDNAAKYWRSTIPVAAPTLPPPPLAPERVVHYVYSRDGVGNTDSLCLSVATSRLGTAGCAIAGGVLGCADNVASDTTLQVCNENDDNQRFGLYRSGSHYTLRSLLGDNQCLTVSQSTRHSACEPFTLAPCADSDRQKFVEENVRRFDGVKIWRNVGTGLSIDVDSYAKRVNQWIWACPGDNAAKYWRSTIPVAAPTPPPPPLAPERVVHYVYSRD